MSEHLNFHGVLWELLNANELCHECILHFMSNQHISMKKISISQMFENQSNFSSLWLIQTFPHSIVVICKHFSDRTGLWNNPQLKVVLWSESEGLQPD